MTPPAVLRLPTLPPFFLAPIVANRIELDVHARRFRPLSGYAEAPNVVSVVYCDD